jgi:hypothetical protein
MSLSCRFAALESNITEIRFLGFGVALDPFHATAVPNPESRPPEPLNPGPGGGDGGAGMGGSDNIGQEKRRKRHP